MEPRKITEETLAAFARQLGEEERSPATLENTCGRSASSPPSWAAVR